MEVHVNTFATLDVLIKCVTLRRENVSHVQVDIGGRFVITHVAAAVPSTDAIANLVYVLIVRIQHCTATSVNRAVISVQTGNVTRMETVHRAVYLTSTVKGVNSRVLKTAVLTLHAAVVTSTEHVYTDASTVILETIVEQVNCCKNHFWIP